ncbi:MAG TPA: ATP-dependent DNA helicase RecG, partial [Chloroflexota bacterium]|nr:ATP-dependent DNA helicase RecG [Chloroflexota bacterium]
MPPSSSRSDPLATLRDILRLEQRRGNDNRAVVGGLGAYVARLRTQGLGDAAYLKRLTTYADLSVEARRAAVADALRGMDDAMRPAPRQPSASARATHLKSDTPVSRLPGVGAARATRLAELGITTVEDLRLHVPHRYVHYPPSQPAASLGFQHLASFEGTVRRIDVAPLPGKRVRITAILGDSTGTIGAVWIRHGGGIGLREGARIAVSGPLVSYGRQVYFENPEYEPADRPPLNTRRIVPVYPLVAGVSQSLIRSLARQALAGLPPATESLPQSVLASEGLMGRDEAIHQLHEPSSAESLEQARTRYAFDEILPIQLMLLQRRIAYRAVEGAAVDVPWGLLAEFRQHLPFSLTGAQQRALSAILEDIAQPRPMVRLLQGEVGSGKTIVAATAVLATIASGGQASIMAPTEILAEQHRQSITALYGRMHAILEARLGRRPEIALLTSALSRTERERTLAAISRGDVDLVIGTHAVIQEDVEFARLNLAVVDEQHRFGVGQRVAIRRKGGNPHLLVMTATPIPRTLALAMYGDLDVSIIDELPAGRQPIQTEVVMPLARDRAYAHVRAEVAEGHQAFVICPLVEESRGTEAKAATTEFERLRQGELAGLRLALLHGRMKSADKDTVMRSFAAGEIDVLVATSVVEVGVDIPNATVMMIESAERFGIAQLHQFRGRVG